MHLEETIQEDIILTGQGSATKHKGQGVHEEDHACPR